MQEFYFRLYAGFIHLSFKYYCPIWGTCPFTTLLDRVDSKAICLIGDPSLTSVRLSFLCPKVVSLSLSSCYYFGH